MNSQESEPFLPFNKEVATDQGPNREKQHIESRWSKYKGIILHCFLIATYTCVSTIAIISSSCRASYLSSPLKDLDIRYKARTFVNLTDHNIYAGPPNPALETAWDALLGNMNLRVSKTELAQDGQDSVALPEGGGHLAWLGAIHELHCIKMLREWKYRDVYHPNITPEVYKHWDSHADHCLDMLRQAAMCHADTSLTTFVWNETKRKPMFDAKSATHMCVDWDALIRSTQHRAVNVGEIQRLQNPLYSDGTGTSEVGDH